MLLLIALDHIGYTFTLLNRQQIGRALYFLVFVIWLHISFYGLLEVDSLQIGCLTSILLLLIFDVNPI